MEKNELGNKSNNDYLKDTAQKLGMAEMSARQSNNYYLKYISEHIGEGGGIPEAPIDGAKYARCNAAWSAVSDGGAIRRITEEEINNLFD